MAEDRTGLAPAGPAGASLDARLRAVEGSDDAAAWNELGCDLSDAGRLVEAEGCFRRAIDLGASWVQFNLGNTLRDLGRTEEARAAYEQAIAAGEDDALLNLGLLHRDEGRAEQARAVLETAVAAGEPAGHLPLGDLDRDEDDLEGAELHYRAALQARDPAAAGALGVLLGEQGRTDEAEPLLRAAAPSDPEARAALGSLLRRTGRLDEGRQVLVEGARAGERQSCLPLGNLLWDEDGDLDGAEAAYRQAIEAGDDFGHHNLGLLLWQTGRRAEAEEEFRLGAAAGDEMAAAALAEMVDGGR